MPVSLSTSKTNFRPLASQAVQGNPQNMFVGASPAVSEVRLTVTLEVRTNSATYVFTPSVTGILRTAEVDPSLHFTKRAFCAGVAVI